MSERWVAGPEGGRKHRADREGKKNGGVDGDWLIGKWIGDKTPQLGAKIRIPSVLNEIFKYTLVRGSILPRKDGCRECVEQ